MKTLERFASAIVFSSLLIFPSYAEAQGRRSYFRNQTTPSQQSRQTPVQAPAGSYYCSNCGQYHRYEGQQNQNPGTINRRGNTIGSQINDAVGTNIANAASAEGIYNGVGNAAKVGEGLKPVFGLLDMMGTLMGGPKQKNDKNTGENYRIMPPGKNK